MHTIDILVDSVVFNELLSFLDGYSSYNEIKIVVEDISKTPLRYLAQLGHWNGWSCPLVLRMPMQLTNNRWMPYFEEMFCKDETSPTQTQSPQVCFYSIVGNFLWLLVHERGIEVDNNHYNGQGSTKQERARKIPRSSKLLEEILSNLVGKTKLFSNLVKVKNKEEFRWEEKH